MRKTAAAPVKETPAPAAKRGRPPKALEVTPTKAPDASGATLPKRRGRPPKARDAEAAATEAVQAAASPPASRRGRKPIARPGLSAAPVPAAETARPFLKWVGGKRQLLDELTARAPKKSYGTYYEPFLGGGAFFFRLFRVNPPKHAVLSDTNRRLVRAYLGVRDSLEELIARLKEYHLRHDKEFFLKLREEPIDERSDVEVAAWLIYLNKTGFNGLYRVNSRNVFNVPFGDYTNPSICDEANLRACSRALRDAEILCQPFDEATKRAKEGDFVYFDPPYVPLSASSYFTSYTADGFGREDQEKLSNVAHELKEKRVHVLLSNSSAPLVRELYAPKGFKLRKVMAARSVNSKAAGRGKIPELLIY